MEVKLYHQGSMQGALGAQLRSTRSHLKTNRKDSGTGAVNIYHESIAQRAFVYDRTYSRTCGGKICLKYVMVMKNAEWDQHGAHAKIG